jgi:hypothetical protein
MKHGVASLPVVLGAQAPLLAGSPSAAQQAQPSPISGGLHLTGTVIAVRTEEREWEKVRYTQTTVSISDGEQVFLFRHRHDEKGFTPPKLFQPVKVKVTRAMTNKGQITVGGTVLTFRDPM